MLPNPNKKPTTYDYRIRSIHNYHHIKSPPLLLAYSKEASSSSSPSISFADRLIGLQKAHNYKSTSHRESQPKEVEEEEGGVHL